MAQDQLEVKSNELAENCTKNPFPGSNISPEIKKTKEFGDRVGKAIYAYHQYYVFNQSRTDRVYENRQYATNNQDPNQYKGIIDPEWNAEQDKKSLYKGSLVNIKWDIWSPLKKMVNRVEGLISDTRSTIQYNSIDKTSKAEKERKKNELLGSVVNRKELEMLSEAIGQDVMNLNGEEQELMTPEDVDVYMDTAYKSIKEIGMEMLVEHNLRLNRFYQDKEPRLIHDLIENNKLCAFATYDRNNRISIRYVDIAGYVHPQSDFPTNEQHEYDGECNLWSISELRDFFYETQEYEPGEDLEKLLYEIAEKAVGAYGNTTGRLDKFKYRPLYNDYPYNDFRVEALWFNYYTIDSEVVRFKEKDGNVYADYRKEIPKQPRHDYVKSDREVVYEGLYLPTMQCVYGWRKQENMCRPYTEKGSSPRATRRFIYVEPNKRMGTSSSLIDDTKGIADDIQITVLKVRQLVAESSPPGFMVDWHGLNEVFLATGDQVDPAELIRLFKTKGIGFYVSRTEDGQFVQAPIHEVKSNFLPQLQAHLQNLQFYLSQIREASGVNEAMDGSMPSDSLVGIQKLKNIAGHQVLRGLLNAYNKQFMMRLGDTLRDMIQTQIRYGMCEEEYRSVVGDAIYEVLKMEPDKAYPLFGTHVETVPDDSQLAVIQRQIELGIQAGQIQPSDVIDVSQMSNVKKIMAVLKYRERKNQRQREAAMQQAVQAEAAKNQSSSQARAESEERIIAAKAKAKQAELTQSHNNKLEQIAEEKTLEGNNKLNEIHATADRDDEQIRLALELQAIYQGGFSGGISGINQSRMPKVKPTGVRKQVSQNTQIKQNQ